MCPMIEQRLQAIKRRSLGKSFHLRQRFGQSSYPIINREPVLPFQYLNNNGQDVKAFVDVYWCHPRVLKLRGRKCPG
ncbi:hypothetical protein ABFA07_015418 [Porites harrisoni]